MSQNQPHSFSLEGQLGLITGGGTGLGLGIAQAFVAQGAQVVLAGRREKVQRARGRALRKTCAVARTRAEAAP